MRYSLKSSFSYDTKRLTVRFMKKKDFKAWKKTLTTLSKKKNQWDIGTVPNNHDALLSFQRSQIAFFDKLRSEDKAYHFGVFEKKTGAFVGHFSLKEVRRGVYQSAETGYHIYHQYWGKGYGKEALKAIVDIGFKHLKLHRIEAGIELHNIRSMRLAKTVGFEKVGLMRHAVCLDGEWKDMIWYHIVND